jgi:hypothetical protein
LSYAIAVEVLCGESLLGSRLYMRSRAAKKRGGTSDVRLLSASCNYLFHAYIQPVHSRPPSSTLAVKLLFCFIRRCNSAHLNCFDPCSENCPSFLSSSAPQWSQDNLQAHGIDRQSAPAGRRPRGQAREEADKESLVLKDDRASFMVSLSDLWWGCRPRSSISVPPMMLGKFQSLNSV